jgi:AraC-like DNA-binding protein
LGVWAAVRPLGKTAMIAATEEEKKFYGGNVEIVTRSADSTVYRIRNLFGDAVMTTYQVFPGIQLTYNDVDTQECSIEHAETGNIMEINHCREGRIECAFKDEYLYLSKGDVAINRKDDAAHDSYFPGGRYSGITIVIDTAYAPNSLSCFLEDVNVELSALSRKFCSGSECCVMRSKPCLEHIFSELYAVPSSIRKGYYKVKVLELLLFLSGMDIDPAPQKYYTGAQVQLAKQVCRFITAHLDAHITIEQLAAIFHVSATQLKTSFKGVYGDSVYAYTRTQKMQAAASFLSKTDQNVMEIAGKVGYDNGSKFARAFRDVMGVSPKKYREQSS